MTTFCRDHLFKYTSISVPTLNSLRDLSKTGFTNRFISLIDEKKTRSIRRGKKKFEILHPQLLIYLKSFIENNSLPNPSDTNYFLDPRFDSWEAVYSSFIKSIQSLK